MPNAFIAILLMTLSVVVSKVSLEMEKRVQENLVGLISVEFTSFFYLFADTKMLLNYFRFIFRQYTLLGMRRRGL